MNKLAGVEAEPWLSNTETVRHEWVDYNDHMNVAYYILVFDHGTDAVLDLLDIGEAYRQRSGCSVFVAEAHVTYEKEVHEGDELEVRSRVSGFNGKRLILYHEMFRDDVLVATNEVLCLHVDLAARRSASIPDDAARRIDAAATAHASLAAPGRAGRTIALKSRRPT